MMHRQKVKLLLWFATLLSVLALVVAPALAIEQFTLFVEKDGAGTGTVTSDDGKINCGADCEETYGGTKKKTLVDRPGMLLGPTVTLMATPDEGSVFTAWGQDCDCQGAFTGPCPIIMGGADRTCTVTFGLPVGGTAVPVNRLGLLASWLGLAALASFATLGVALVRRRRA